VPARIIDGRAEAAKLRTALAQEATRFRAAAGRPARLVVLLVGEHPASLAYVGSKARTAEATGIRAEVLRLDAATPGTELVTRIGELNAKPTVDGILIQLPLPAGIEPAPILEAIDPAKDVDGFHPLNIGRLFAAARPDGEGMLVPCTPLGCLFLLRATLGSKGLAGRRAVVVGRSNIVGKPMAALLLGADCTVTVAHSRSRDLPAECRRAEILVAAVGRPELIRGDWVGEGAVVIDVGINRLARPDGSTALTGDVAFAEAAEKASAITPVPGGVGPMTVACLLRNTLTAAWQRLGGRGG
jgi:methylenetetrahydrofolate dehydrogenase (NADP+)/methenyltetrahydrofolate cyclohydrolase